MLVGYFEMENEKLNLWGGGGTNTQNMHAFMLQLLGVLLSQYTIQRVNFVLGYSKIEIFQKLDDILACPFLVQ